MSSERIFLDAASGAPLSAVAISAMTSASRTAFAAQNALHSEGKLTASIRQAATAQIAHLLDTPTSEILPVSNPAQVFQIFANFLNRTESPVSINAGSRKAFLGLLRKQVGAEVVHIDESGMEMNLPSHGWHVTQAGNAETGVISTVSDQSLHSLKKIVDATEWVGRMPGLPEGEFKFIRASSWGGGNLICFIIGPINELKLDSLSVKAVSPETTALVAAATALTELPTLIAQAPSHRKWISDFISAANGLDSIQTLNNLGPTLPHVFTFIVEHIEAEFLAAELDRRGIAVGAGSACGIETGTSHVLAAMGKPNVANIRIGLPHSARQSDLENLLAELPGAISAVRN
jgi:selenocysteine lyase/cysteine desulfurase